MPDVKARLNELIEMAEAELTPLPGIQSVSGTINTTRFFNTTKLHGHNTALAVTTRIDESENTEKENKVILETQKVLVDAGVDMKFIQNFLYFDEKGKKISLRAFHGSLGAYLDSIQYHLSRDDIKVIMGQLLLGLRALHTNNLVHRDVSADNTLATTNAFHEMFLQYCDLDTVKTVNPNGTVKGDYDLEGGTKSSPELRALMTRGYDLTLWSYPGKPTITKENTREAEENDMPILLRKTKDGSVNYFIYGRLTDKKTKQAFWGWEKLVNLSEGEQDILKRLPFNDEKPVDRESELFRGGHLYNILQKGHNKKSHWSWVGEEKDYSAYEKIDLKAADCYALGKVFEELIDCALPGSFSEAERKNLLSLCKASPEDRATALSACDDPFFGATQQERLAFFESLQTLQSPYEYIGPWRARAFEANNRFLLFRDDLQRVIALAQTFMSQCDYFDFDNDILKEKNAGMIKYSLASLKNTITALNEEMATFTPACQFYPKLTEFKKAANDQYADIEKRFIPKQKNYIKEFDAAMDWLEKIVNDVYQKYYYKPFLKNMLKEIRAAASSNSLAEQDLPLLIELAYGVVITSQNSGGNENIKRLNEIAKSMAALFPALSAQLLEHLKKEPTLSGVWIFAKRGLTTAIAAQKQKQTSLEYKTPAP